MISRAVALLALMLIACDPLEPGPDVELDAGPVEIDATVDARETDGIPWPDAPPGTCPYTPASPITPPNGPPSGTWRLTWHCIGGCGVEVRPPLVSATHIDVQAGNLHWRAGTVPLADHAAVPSGNCQRVQPDTEDGCRTPYDLCSVTSGANVMVISWLNTETGWRQTWEALGVR
jgi:hypothetical protein